MAKTVFPKYETFEKLIAERGINTAEVASKTGIDPGMFTKWKNNVSYPGIESLKKLADYFYIPIEYLL